VIRPGPDLQSHGGLDIGRFPGGTGTASGRVTKQQRLPVRVIPGQFHTPCRRGRFSQSFAENGQKLGQELFADDFLARFGQGFEAVLSLLSRSRVQRIAFAPKAQFGAVERQVHIFRKAFYDPEHFGQRSAALEE
jgi:hypothetical protein